VGVRFCWYGAGLATVGDAFGVNGRSRGLASEVFLCLFSRGSGSGISLSGSRTWTRCLMVASLISRAESNINEEGFDLIGDGNWVK
jgi:hypothetical protein